MCAVIRVGSSGFGFSCLVLLGPQSLRLKGWGFAFVLEGLRAQRTQYPLI